MADVLVRVVSPWFVAGLIVRDDRCIRAAPILRHFIGLDAAAIRRIVAKDGWRASIVLPQQETRR
jgi:hypothetical protein